MTNTQTLKFPTGYVLLPTELLSSVTNQSKAEVHPVTDERDIHVCNQTRVKEV